MLEAWSPTFEILIWETTEKINGFTFTQIKRKYSLILELNHNDKKTFVFCKWIILEPTWLEKT